MKGVRINPEKLRQLAGRVLADRPMPRQDLAHVRLAAKDRRQIHLPQTTLLQRVPRRPIAIGPVGGACKNLIKERMDRSGIRWTHDIAEAIVKLRSLYLSPNAIQLHFPILACIRRVMMRGSS